MVDDLTLDMVQFNTQVILVGHSMGGTSVAQATERFPHKIHATVFVAGAMLSSGMSQSDNHKEQLGELFFQVPPMIYR